MNLRNVLSPPWRTVALVGIFIAVLVAAVVPADASHQFTRDPRLHWNNASYDWHWGSNLDDHHFDFQLPSNAAWWLTWQAACCPDSPWHTHFNTSAGNHIDTVFFNLPPPLNAEVYGAAVTVYDGNSLFHMNSAQVWFNHDNFDGDGNQSDDLIYRGSGTPPSGQLDAWSIASEEFGHVQNLDHFGGTGCSGGYRTMAGFMNPGQTCKRTTVQAEREAAIEGYELSH